MRISILLYCFCGKCQIGDEKAPPMDAGGAGMIVRLLHQRQDCLRALFLDECRSGVSLTLRETPQLIEKVHQSVVFSADERVYRDNSPQAGNCFRTGCCLRRFGDYLPSGFISMSLSSIAASRATTSSIMVCSAFICFSLLMPPRIGSPTMLPLRSTTTVVGNAVML